MDAQAAGEGPPVALVTGAGRGLGRGVAVELARSGFSVVLNYARNREAAQEAARECSACAAASATAAPAPSSAASATAASAQFLPLQADIGVASEREALVRGTLERLGRIDALVNNAGVAPRVRADITEASEESFEELLRINLQGPYFLTQRVASYWLSERPRPLLPGGFKLVFITSISAESASVNRGEYCVAKAGLSMAARLWALRLAAEGVQVFELRPGIMATDMTRGVRDKYDRLIAEGVVPERRWGAPQDVGRAAAALLRGELPFCQGSIIHVDGGLHLPRL
jgi:NAD(P)-dependent dehydrogenase (short-subunit alcohol dehydrogenase family)